jgi:hypothetical protein
VTLGVVVLAHRGPEQVARLLAALEHREVRRYLHLDARVDPQPFQAALRRAGVAEVAWLPRRPTRWGGPEIVDASLDGLRAALADGCGYVVQVSGQDFPLWPVERMVAFFTEHADRSFLEHVALPDDRWRHGGRLRTECWTFSVLGRRETHVPARFPVPMSWKGRVLNALLGVAARVRGPRRVPSCARLHGGSQWWNLSGDAVRFVLDFVEAHPGYRAYHRHTLLPDELFFQSILAGTDFPRRHPVVNDSLRYMEWPAGRSHPRLLTLADLPALEAAEAPFARKFDAAVDGSVLDALEARWVA